MVIAINIENKIRSLRSEMHNLMHKNNLTTTYEVIKVSQELDEVLNEYYKLHKN